MILADEPTGNLDTATGADVIDLLAGLATSHGATVIVATHDADLAARAPRRLAMRDGKLVGHSPSGSARRFLLTRWRALGQRTWCSAQAASALVLLASGAVVSAPVAPAAPQLDRAQSRPASCDAAAILRGAGATTVAASLRLYRFESRAAATRAAPSCAPAGHFASRLPTDRRRDDERYRLRRSAHRHGVVARRDRRRRAHPAGAGKPITIVDSGVDVAHPGVRRAVRALALNAQEPQPIGGVHGTAVASVIGAPANGVGIVGIYPDALLQTWDAAVGSGTALAHERDRRRRARCHEPGAPV